MKPRKKFVICLFGLCLAGFLIISVYFPFSNFRPHLLFYMQMSAQLHYMLIMLVFQTESIKKKKS